MAFRDLVPWRWGKGDARMPSRLASWRDPFENLRHEMNRILDSFFREWPLPETGGSRDRWGDFTPHVDMVETENEIEIKAELPGLSEKEIDITLSDGILTLKGEKRHETQEQRGGMHYRECSYGAFHREICLPCATQDEKAEATFKQGVLSIRIPKAAEAKPKGRKIEIKQG